MQKGTKPTFSARMILGAEAHVPSHAFDGQCADVCKVHGCSTHRVAQQRLGTDAEEIDVCR